jgi:hypothetical protein
MRRAIVVSLQETKLGIIAHYLMTEIAIDNRTIGDSSFELYYSGNGLNANIGTTPA